MSLMIMDQDPEFLNLTNEIFTRQLENNQGLSASLDGWARKNVSGRPIQRGFPVHRPVPGG